MCNSICMYKVRSSTIVEVITAMVILCIVVLMAYTFLADFINKDHLPVYDLVVAAPDYSNLDDENFNLSFNKQYKISYKESLLGANLIEVELVYYTIEGKALCRRCWLKCKD